MATLRYIYELRKQPVLIGAVTAACMSFSRDIQNEAVNTPNHAARLAWSMRSPDQNAIDIMPSIVMNSQVQLTWESRTNSQLPEWERFDDGDILFIVSSWINTYVVD